MQLQRLGLWRLYPFEALVEIFDFVAGLVQRVPKKPSIVKVDLQNSTSLRVTTTYRHHFEKNQRKTVTLSVDGEATRNRSSRMGINGVRFSMDD